MLRPMPTFHYELELNRRPGVEIKTTKKKVLYVSVMHSRAQQDKPCNKAATRKAKDSPRQIHKVRREGENRHGHHKARQEGEDSNRYHNVPQEGGDWHGHYSARHEGEGGHVLYIKARRGGEDLRGYHKSRRAKEDQHGYHKSRRTGEDRHGYHKARRAKEDPDGHHKTRQEGEDWNRYHRAQREGEYQHRYNRAQRESKDPCGYLKARQEQEGQHGFYTTQRGQNRLKENNQHEHPKARQDGEDQHGYHKVRRGEEDRHGYHMARQEKEDQHGSYKARREEEDAHGFKCKKTKTASRAMHTFQQNATLSEKECHSLDFKNRKSTSEMINGRHQKAHFEKNARECAYEQQKLQDDAIALVALLKECAKDKDLNRGSAVHAEIITRGLLKNNVFIGSALVNMYAKCGAIEKAQKVFDKLPAPNVVSWTTLIAGYAHLGHAEEALSRFELMQLKGFSPDAFTFACVLRACTSVKAFDRGKAIHSLIAREYPSMEENTHVGTALVDMYSKWGALEKAEKAFDKLQIQDVVSWTALIAGYAQHGQGEEALISFEQMQHEGLFPDGFTFACVLKACGSIQAALKGQSIHAQVVRHGLLKNNMFVGTALVDMYARCGMLAEAQDSFNKLHVRDVVAWSALIEGYAQHGHDKEALKHFEKMQQDGFTPDVLILTCVLKACGRMGASNQGEEIYARIVKEQRLDVHIGTMLVDMFARCGALDRANEVFSKLEVRDVVLWTALIAGYTLHGHEEEALGSFEQMQSEGVYPDAVTFASLLKACGNIGAVQKGQELHAGIVRHGLSRIGTNVGTALVDMYANLGLFMEAQEVFNKLDVQDLVSWSVLIAGYAQLGEEKSVFGLFDQMIQEGKQPDPVIFIAILNTCSHKGLVDEGQFYFELISKKFHMFPIIEHHTCIIDLFGRAGHLDKAVAVIEGTSLSANLTLWHTFLGACQKWGNTKLGSWAFEHARQVSEVNASPYVALRNIYSEAGYMDIGGHIGGQRSKHRPMYMGV